MRTRIYNIIEKADNGDILSKIYDVFMLIIIALSIIPLTFKETFRIWVIIDYICTTVFIIDYILRWLTADIKINKKMPFIRYPITPMAIIDLLAVLPTFGIISRTFRVLKVLRGLKVFRIFKTLRYSNNFIIINNVIKKNSSILLSLLVCAVFYIIVSALFIFSIEPENFANFFESLYWATTVLTTVGYGDIYPISDGGKIISMISSFFGVAMVALPSGVITAGFMKELDMKKEMQQ